MSAEATYIFLPPDEQPSQAAMDAWYAKQRGGSDSPRVTVWSPTSLPECYVDTRNKGCNEPPTLPKHSRWCSLRMGGVEFRMEIWDGGGQ